MTQRSLFWDGEATGDHGPYAQAHLMDRFFRAIFNGTGNRGPLKGWGNGLAVTGTATPLSVADGAGIVYGMFHTSDEAVSVAVPTPSSGNSRYDRIVLRRAWATQQVRVARISGVAAAAPAVPALTQTPGSVYDVPLATVLVDDAGAIAVTDAREFCQFTTAWPAGSVGAAKYAAGAVTAAKIENRTRWDLKGAGQIAPDSAAPAAWVAGASYDYRAFVDAATNAAWVYFQGPFDVVGGTVDIYVWSIPDTNGAGGGAENCHWDYTAYTGTYGGALASASGHVDADQQARVNTTPYADLLIDDLALPAGSLLILKLSRDGAADSYNHDMRLMGVEMRWTADA